jgi:hypothetical protein
MAILPNGGVHHHLVAGSGRGHCLWLCHTVNKDNKTAVNVSQRLLRDDTGCT